MPPPDRPDSRNQTKPVGKQNEYEHRRKKPKCSIHQVMPDNAFEKVMEALHHPLPEILRSFRDFLHVARGHLRENNQTDCYNPSDHHRVGNRKTKRTPHFHGVLWETVFLRSGMFLLSCSFGFHGRSGCRGGPTKGYGAREQQSHYNNSEQSHLFNGQTERHAVPSVSKSTFLA